MDGVDILILGYFERAMISPLPQMAAGTKEFLQLLHNRVSSSGHFADVIIIRRTVSTILAQQKHGRKGSRRP